MCSFHSLRIFAGCFHENTFVLCPFAVFKKLDRETCVRVWYKLKAISGDGSLRGVDKVSFCNTVISDHFGLFNEVEMENLTNIQTISDLSTPLLSALKRLGSPILEAVHATLVTTKDQPGALQHSVIADTLLQCATEGEFIP